MNVLILGIVFVLSSVVWFNPEPCPYQWKQDNVKIMLKECELILHGDNHRWYLKDR